MTSLQWRSSDTFLISACLLGVNCRYDGQSKSYPPLYRIIKHLRLVPVCPEQLGGLPTPRKPAEIKGGDGLAVLLGRAQVLNNQGEDVSEAFIRGAREVLKLAQILKIQGAILKSRSPSCGLDPLGVTAAALRQAGVKVYEF